MNAYDIDDFEVVEEHGDNLTLVDPAELADPDEIARLVNMVELLTAPGAELEQCRRAHDNLTVCSDRPDLTGTRWAFTPCPRCVRVA